MEKPNNLFDWKSTAWNGIQIWWEMIASGASNVIILNLLVESDVATRLIQIVCFCKSLRDFAIVFARIVPMVFSKVAS